MVESYNLEYIFFYSSIPFLVIGMIGNVLVIRIVHKTREMHKPTNYLLVSMAVSDVIIILMWPLYYLELWKFLCKSFALSEISIMVSSITLTVLAVERYHAVLKPLRNELRLNEDNIKKALVSIWIASVFICLPELFFNEWSETYSSCIGPWTLHMNRPSKVYVIINVVLSIYIPLVVICYCYGSLMKELYFSNTVYPEADVDERSLEKKKVVITFIMVTVGFFIGSTPTGVFYTIIPSGDNKTIQLKLYADLQNAIDFAFVCSLCFNPAIYAFRSKNFQEGFKRILLCRKPMDQNV